MLHRTLSLITALMLAGALVPAELAAQDFPAKPLRLLIPYPVGNSPDILGRVLAKAMTVHLGQPVIVQNKGGAGGVIAIVDLKNSPADGYTLFLSDNGQWGILPAIQPDSPYDPVRDFAAIGMLGASPLYFFTSASSGINTMEDVVARARAKPGALRYGITGVNGIMHLIGEAFRSGTKIDVSVVPYRATNETVASVLSGDLDYAIAGGNPLYVSMVKQGKLRSLAVTSLKRDDAFPDLPTVAETSTLKDYDYQLEFAVFATGGTPRPVIDKVSDAVQTAQKDPEFVAIMKKLEYKIVSSSPADLQTKIRDDLAKFRAIVKAANITAK